MLPSLHSFALICLALMTGTEFCVAAFVEPILRKLPENVQVASAPLFAGRLGKAMPGWYALSLILTLADLWRSHAQAGFWSTSLGLAAALQAFIVIATISVLVPINNRLAAATSAYEGFHTDATRWDALHRARVALLLVATLLVAL